jgi:hypothetical protein
MESNNKICQKNAKKPPVYIRRCDISIFVSISTKRFLWGMVLTAVCLCRSERLAEKKIKEGKEEVPAPAATGSLESVMKQMLEAYVSDFVNGTG